MSTRKEVDRILRQAFDREPSPYPKMLMALGNGRDVVLNTYSLTFDAFVDAYFQGARRLSLGTSRGVLFNFAILPILFLCRHFVELVLKASIQSVGRLIMEHDTNFEQISPEGHHLSKLLGDLCRLHGVAKPFLEGLNLPSKQAQGLIKELDAFDEGSTKLRYPHLRGTKRRAIDKDVRINLDVLDAGMLHVYKELRRYWNSVSIAADLHREHKRNLSDW